MNPAERDSSTQKPLAAWRDLTPWLAVLFLLLVVMQYWGPAPLRRIDHQAGDALLTNTRDTPPPSDIVLVDIDQASLEDKQMLELAGRWPWARAAHGELITFLAAQKPKAIVFDLTFSEPDTFRPDSDKVLIDAIKTSPVPVYLPIVIANDGLGTRLADLPPQMGIRPQPKADPAVTLPLVVPNALPREQWRTGHINFLTDSDGFGRQAPIYREHRGWHIPGLAARVAADLGARLPARPSVIMHWYSRPFTHLSYAKLYLSALSSNPKPPIDLAGKIIIIGSTAPGLVDFRLTPLSTQTPGQEILATAMANLREESWLRPAPGWWSPLLATMLVLACALGFRRGQHPLWMIGGLLIVSLVALLLTYALLGYRLQWQPYSALSIGWLACFTYGIQSYLREKRRREHAVQLFNRFLDPRVVQQLTGVKAMADAEVGHSRELTVLFSDIRGFTTLSETRPPEEIVSILNRYFERQVEMVFQHGGTLDKFIGDAIMAFWGAPVATSDHAARAVAAALDMSDRLDAFREESGYHQFEIGIGVHTGPAVVGFIGTSRRLDYTAIGDTVNLASRIEGQTKGISRVLVSEATRNACGDAFEFIDHGEFSVKGRAQPVRLFEPRRKT